MHITVNYTKLNNPMSFQGKAYKSDTTDQETMSRINEFNTRQIAKYDVESTGAITRFITEIIDKLKHI